MVELSSMATSFPVFLISYEFSHPIHQFPVFSHVAFVGVFSLYFSSPSGLISSIYLKRHTR